MVSIVIEISLSPLETEEGIVVTSAIRATRPCATSNVQEQANQTSSPPQPARS